MRIEIPPHLGTLTRHALWVARDKDIDLLDSLKRKKTVTIDGEKVPAAVIREQIKNRIKGYEFLSKLIQDKVCRARKL